jgi:hypothetical protein
MLKTLGSRLKLCRTLLNITSKYVTDSIEKINNISLNKTQYIRWENDTIKAIRNDDALKAIYNLFKSKGLGALDYNWLKDGVGIPPIALDISQLDENSQTHFFYKQLNNNNKYNIKRVSGNYGEPYAPFSSEIIIESATLINTLKDKVSYIVTKDETIYIGKLDVKSNLEVTILNNNHKIDIVKSNIKYQARVVWIHLD